MQNCGQTTQTRCEKREKQTKKQARKMEKRSRAWGREIRKWWRIEGKKCSVIWKNTLCFSVCSIFLLNAASFVSVAGERRRSGRWSKRGTMAQALILYAHYPPENANSVFKGSTGWSVTLFQVSINVSIWMCLTEVNDSSFSPCSPCLCLLSISVFPLQRLQDVSLIAV